MVSYPSAMRTPWLLPPIFVLGAACGDFKSSAPAADAGDAGSTQDSASADSGGATGPGPFGAMPTGYCCTKNEDCRFRNCATIGGVQMCSDPCDTNDGCNVKPGYTCVGATPQDSGRCEPTAPGTACIPAATFPRGGKKLGQCCTATHDANAGLECEGGQCGSFGDVSNPYICTNVCTKPADCPGNYLCSPVTNTYSICLALATTYTCN